MAWQRAQEKLQVKWSSICNELHIDETPQQLFSSLPFKYSTILNDVSMERVKHKETTHLGKFK